MSPGARRARSVLLALTVIAAVVVACVIAAALGSNRSAASSGFTASGAPAAQSPASDTPADGGGQGGSSEADGAVADHVTVFDDVPAVVNLDEDLLDAVRRAASDAADDGVTLEVNSGWRSREYQDHLLHDAIAQYGSAAEAARWVATADTSAHVAGEAIDIGPWDARDWLAQHGAAYGLCQIYGNEPWHYELRPAAADTGCPAPYADPTQDPRMQQP